ncbi:hypothetical protein GF343_01715 [Candidatus Woesearchaeota archaeon]|nr:hypothetical protein [Candidatus Woesearchaeota archaeon]
MARKKRINKKMLVSMFIIAIMVLSAFGFIFSYQTSQPSEKLDDYKGHEFKKTAKGYTTEINDQKLYFDYYPGDLEQINITEDTRAILSQSEVFVITYDPNSDFAESIAEKEFDLEQKTGKTGKPLIAKGLTNATGYALPQITCKNATKEMPVIRMKRGKTSEIKTDKNCIIIEAETEPILNTFYTRVLYIIFGVMN